MKILTADRLESQIIKRAVERIVNHPLYDILKDENNLRRFMHWHVFCVWDFQSLLKTLQRYLTCVNVPWIPTRDPLARRLINEIVLEEESDKVGEGYLSHFELYLLAMDRAGADRKPIDEFIATLQEHGSVKKALENSGLPDGVSDFVSTTFSIIESGKVHCAAAAFAYGREDLIPNLFQPILSGFVNDGKAEWDPFLDYLNRHIEYDGERHGPLSKALVARLCADDEKLWVEAEVAASLSLEARLKLWENIYQSFPVEHEIRTSIDHKDSKSKSKQVQASFEISK